ncbi:MAG TPA: hypothetical protein VHO05_13655 [Hyphomicrobium sp.]|nr:hypothetical protein [Hyphomicrobium sp.]
MNDLLKHLGQTLHHYFGAVVQQPMPWRVIDRLASLEEACERQASATQGGSEEGSSLSEPPPLGDAKGGKPPTV